MKSKTLITMAVASTFGLSAAVFAGSGHEVVTPSSPNESAPSLVSQHKGFHSTSMTSAMAPSQSITESTGHELTLSDASDWSASFDQMAEADVSDVYLIGFAPVDTWDYYVIDMGSSQDLALLGDETYYLIPFDVVFMSDDGYSMTQEQQVNAVLSEAPSFDTAEVG